MRDPDVLDLAAREHRELQRALRDALSPRNTSSQAQDRIDDLISSVARHEAIDRLLLYPLVGRDTSGRRALVERRAEQRSISDQLAKIRRGFRSHDPAKQVAMALEAMRLTFTGHSDREEIEDFPHARRLSSADERQALAELRVSLRDELHQRLPHVPTTADARSGATTAEDRLGPVQIAIVNAKSILVELDRSVIGVG